MKKVIFQGLIIIAIFFATLFTLRQINWMSLFQVEQATEKLEEKLGDLFWDVFNKSENEIRNITIKSGIDSIVSKLCDKNRLDRSRIKVHILNKDEINAFALPNGHLVIYSGLILASENPEELSGVISHELAHIELNHVMKKLIKEVGLSMLISMTTSGGGSEIIKETAKTLSSSAFDRTLEKEADIKAVDYLIKSNIDVESFANFLFRLSDSDTEITKYFSWISTHPESKERASYIIDYSRGRVINKKSILHEETWKNLVEEISELNP
ncbi:MAG: hypothetical protein RI909_2379 [Bacteroidota bacterium]|jgi:predicted Zn-dependent protease